MKFLKLLLTFLFVGPLFAASIQWEAPRDISGPSDFNKEGYYYGAWSPGQTTYPVGTVNGVQMRGDDLELTTSGFNGQGPDFGTHTTTDATYNQLLRQGTWSNGTSASFTINGTGRRPLTPGRQYLIQVWVSDARAEINGRTQTVSGSGTLSFKTGSGMGQHVTGRFTADAATQTITLSANASAQVNLVVVRDVTPEEAETRQQRWKRLKYGIFSHYTYAATATAEESANRFNAEAYANDLAAAGVQYVVWTAWHSNTVPMFSSVSLPKYGWGGTQRDCVSAMIDAVRAKGIRVFLYVHPYQPITSPTERWNDCINELFAEAVDRYGPRIDGLWLDENMTDSTQDRAVDYNRLLETIKTRNPDLVLMQNGLQMYTIERAGPETVGDWNYARWECMYNLATPWINITAEDMLRTTIINAAGNYDGGGIHWSIDGKPDAGLDGPERIFKCWEYLAPIRDSVFDTKPSASFPPPYVSSQLRYASVNQWLATEKLDDSKVYIHVLKPPAGTVLTLPTPVDGKVFSSAKLLANGHPVGLTQNLHDGVRLTLPETDPWNPLNTVIELTVASKGGAGHVNNTSRNITYAGASWIHQKHRGNGEFADDVHLATTNGDAFTFTFNGTDIKYITSRGPDRGLVDIYIDDVLHNTVDLSTGTPGSRQVVFSISGLPRGQHTLKGVKRNGNVMEVDCFKVTDVVNNSDPEMAGAFKTTMNASANYGGDLGWWQPGNGGIITPVCAHYPGNEPLSDPLNNEPVGGDWFEVTFTGTGIDIPLMCQFAWAYFYVKVDGVFHSNVDIWLGQDKTLSISGLAHGQHTVRCIAWRSTPDQAQPGHRAITITRPDTWTAASGRGFGELGDDVHYTDLNPGTFSWNFDGSGVEPITTRDRDARMAWFGVTGPEVNLSARIQNFSRQREVGTSAFSLPYLRRGNHTLTITHGANMRGLNFSVARLAIDGVRVFKGETLTAPALSWSPSGSGGNGSWDVNQTANWHDGIAATTWPTASGSEDAAIFGGTAGTVSLTGTVHANRLQFNTTGYALQNGTLTLNGTSPTIATLEGVSATIHSPIIGTAGLQKTGTGALLLTSANSYSGTTAVIEGALTLQNTTNSRAFHIEGGAVLDLNVASGSRDGAETRFTGRGTLRKSGAGQLAWGSNAATFALASGARIDVQGGVFTGGSFANEDWSGNLADLNVGGGAVFSGVEANVRVNALSGTGTIRSGYTGAGYAHFTFGVDNGSGTFTGVLADDTAPGHFVKTGFGSQTLAGPNTYTGTTTVNGGTLIVNGSLAAASAVTVASNATLGGTGTIGGSVTVQSGGTLSPGTTGVGTLTVGSAALAGRLAMQVDGENVDRLAVAGNLDISACTLDFSKLIGGITRLEYVIATYGSLTGSAFAGVTGLPHGYQLFIDSANRRIMLVGQLIEAPRGLAAAGGVGRVSLGWLPTVGGTEGVYQIERATSGSGPFTVLASSVTGGSYVDTTVADGTKYFYQVRVSAGGTVGPASNVAAAATAAAGTLPPGWQQANVGTAAGSPATSHTGGVFAVGGAGTQITTGQRTDSFRFVFLPIVGDCTITARVLNIGSANSAAKAGVMIRESLVNNARHASTLIAPNATRAFIWRQSTNGRSGATSQSNAVSQPWLRVVRSGASFSSFWSSDGSNWTQLGTTQTITMSTTAACYVGLAVASGSTSTLANAQFSQVSIVGGRPTNLAASVAGNQVHLSWTGVPNASGYLVKRATTSGGPFTSIGTTTSSSFSDAPTADGRLYYYVVSATVSGGESADSDQVVIRPEMTLPATVTGLSTSISMGEIVLNWDAAANATGYSVRRGTSAGGPFNQIAITTATGYTDSAIVSGTVYYYTIVALNADNEGAACPPVAASLNASGTWISESAGPWNRGLNWQSGVIASGAGRSATFAQTAAVSIDQNVSGLTLGSLSLTGGDVTLQNGAVTLATSSGAPSASVAAARTLRLAGPLAGSAGLTKTGDGTLALSGANTHSGGTQVQGGTLRLEHPSALGVGGISMFNGTALHLRADTDTTFAGGDGLGGLGYASVSIDVNPLAGGPTSRILSFAPGGFNTWNTTIHVTGGSGYAMALGSINEGFSGALTLNASSADLTIGAIGRSSPVSSFTVTGNANTTITGSISAGGMVKSGNGTLTLAGASGYAGVIDIQGGMLVASHHQSLGIGGHNGATMTFVRDQATLALQGGVSLDEHFHVWGTGTGGLGAIRSINGQNSLTNSPGGAAGYCLRSDTTVGVDAGSLSVSGFYQDGGSFGIRKTGTGNLILATACSYTGPTWVDQGTLHVNSSTTAQSAVAVSNNATLGGTGTIGGAITVHDGGTLSPGNSIGTLTTGASVVLNGTLAIEIDGSTADRLHVSGNLDITKATLAITGTATEPEYIIASYGSRTAAAFATITGLPAGYVLDYTTNNQIRLVAAPAPPTFGSWISDNHPSLADKTPAGDPDNDGMENALEYVLGGNPSQPDSGIAPTVTTSGSDLVFTFRRSLASKTEDIILDVEAGTNLSTWPELYPIDPGTPGVSIAETHGQPDAITVIIPQGNATSKFARLKVHVTSAP